ncbi:hypothetical protein N9A35_00840 [bacterium]|nr:hypothetical protein [bacterium]
MTKLNSHNEWDKLKEVIVGSAANTSAVLTWKKNSNLNSETVKKAKDIAKNAFPKWYLDEVEEDLSNLAKKIENFGAKVFRPEPYKCDEFFSTQHWKSTGNNIYNARDLNLVVGNKLIESPSHVRSRYFESTTLYKIWYENYFDDGFVWIAAPKPLLKNEVSLPYYKNNERIMTDEDMKFKKLTKGRVEKLHRLTEDEILFEAANTLRMGKDLLYLVSSSGNLKGYHWLKSVLGKDYRVHVTTDLYRSAHIDSTAMCLRPGLVLLNSTRVSEKNCPKIFEKWDKIWFEDVAPTADHELEFQSKIKDPMSAQLKDLGFSSNLEGIASPWVGMNILSLDTNTVLIDERQTNLIKVLNKHKIQTIPVKMRHMCTQAGGLHCVTLDTVRESKLESYFD